MTEHELWSVATGNALRPSTEDLRTLSRIAWDHWKTLHDSMPVWRTAEQERQLNEAYLEAEEASWRAESAEFWEKYARIGKRQ